MWAVAEEELDVVEVFAVEIVVVAVVVVVKREEAFLEALTGS